MDEEIQRRRVSSATEPASNSPPQFLETVDGEPIETVSARTLCRRLFLGGCALLPWLWFANVWLFWPHLQRHGDPVVRKYAQRSAVGFLIVSAILLPWTLTFSIGGPSVVGQDVFQRWNVAGLDLQSWGLLM